MARLSAAELEEKRTEGKALLAQSPADLAGGLNLLMIAANAGDAEAERIVALYTAAGFGLPQSWPAALDRLARAAERGSTSAREELRLLAGAPAGVADAMEMRRGIDVKALLGPPPMQTVFARPRVATVEGFASHAVCDWLIARAAPKLEPALLFDAERGSRRDPGRSNTAHHFTMIEKDLVFLAVQSRIAAVTERALDDMEVPAILHYAPGEEFLPHVDYVDEAAPGYARQVAEMGQRVVTFLLYLNDDYEGGETDFPVVSWRHKGKKGDAMFFWNVEPDGKPDGRTMHAGLPTRSGEKWLFSQWIRARPRTGRG